MSGIAIYMEGGGDAKESRADLRRGMNRFLDSLETAARKKSLHWKLVCCGSRNKAFHAFRKAPDRNEYDMTVLLVDAEGPVDQSPRAHLRSRDGWDSGFAAAEDVHLMVQTMEAWIVADPDALARYYGPQFARNALPAADDLETVAKADIDRALVQATRNTKKGRYHKTRHAPALLRKIDPAKAQRRCPGCARLFDVLSRAIDEARSA